VKDMTTTDSGETKAGKRASLGGAGMSGWLLIGFFVLLLAINATFFAVAFNNPPELTNGTPPSAPANVDAPADDGNRN